LKQLASGVVGTELMAERSAEAERHYRRDVELTWARTSVRPESIDWSTVPELIDCSTAGGGP
jgi:hypothetical protein